MRLKILFNCALCLLAVLFFSTEQFAQISIPNASFTDAQDFSTLASSGTSSTVPTGWAFAEAGANQNALYTAGTGSGNAGDTYSFGLAGNSERAFGGLQSGNLIPTVGVCYTNNTGAVITELTVNYTGETWRVGAASRTDGIQFQYNQNTTGISGAGTWTSFPSLDYFNPGQATGSGTMQHSALISAPITGLSIQPGATFCFRWVDFNATGADDGIGVDDYSLTNIIAPSPCASITTLPCNTAVAPSLTGSGLWNTSFCGNSTLGSEVIYSFTPTSTGVHTLIINGVGGDPVDFGYKAASGGCSSSGWNCIGTSTGTSFFTFGPLTAGVEYYILLDAHTTVFSAQNFEINCAPVPANDLCSNAITIPAATGNICGTTLGANPDIPNSGANCGTSADGFGAGVWYTFQGTGQTWDFFFPQQGEDWDPEVNVYSGTCGSLTCVTGDDDSGGGLSAQFSVNSVSGTTYYVYVHPADDFGNGTSDFCFDVTLSGTPPVVLTCPTNTTVAACQTQAAVNAAFATWLATASGTGGCNGVLTNNNTGAPSACGGSTTVTFTYTSTCAPLTTTCQATFTVAAPPGVELNCPINTTIGACQTQAAVNAQFNAWLGSASASGGCNGVLTNNNTGAPPACGGSTTVTFTYTSTCAPLTTTCQATFTVPAAPTVILTCPTNTTAAACQTQAAINTAFATWLATATASGGCNGVLTNNNTGAPSACGGSTTVTFTYTSTCAPLTTTCQATFTVTAAPTVILTCPTNTTAAACQSQTTVDSLFGNWLATATASGGCNGVLTNNNTGAPSAGGGSTTVTFTYTSTCAPTTTTCQATFTVAAAPPVVLTCPINTTVAACQTQAAVNAQFAAWLATASASGGCNGVLTNNNTGAPSACGGSTTVTFTYTSTAAPTTTTCQATFTVAAAPPVMLTCTANLTVASCQTQAAINAQFASWLSLTSGTGGCNGVLTNNNTGAPSACGGSTTVTFTYTSSCAPTTTTCQSTFTVAASTPVVLNCPVPTTASACLTQAQLNTAYSTWLASATTSGGCGGTITNNAPAAPLICSATAQTVTVTFSVTNACTGVATTCTSTFTVPAYPDFTVPANGATTVSCPSQITQPTPPTILDACSKVLTPTGPVIVNNPNPITCEGTRTYTWTYTDCSGHVKTWSHVVTVERQPFGVPTNGGTTVSCPDLSDVQPAAPVVTSNCGEVLTPVVTSSPKLGCEGNRNWYFTYTDCEGNTATWTFIYTVEYQDFTVPASEVVTMNCPINIMEPTPPTVVDACGKTLTPTGPVVTKTNNANGCEGVRKYEWTYKDCEGNTHTWSKTFNFEYEGDFFVYPDGETQVGCLDYAQFPPVPPTVYGICGEEVFASGPVVTENIDPNGCSGTRKFTFTYTDCGGNSHPWSFTYHAVDNEPPVGNCPGGSLTNSVDETNLDCIEEVPCPGDYDFSLKIQQLLAAGDIHDLCSGDDLVVELDSWTALWQCSDPDGDGNYTFGRTFYFSIADKCGNLFPDLCSVTYSGSCLPLETYPQGEWGNAGGEPGNTLPGGPTDIQVITTLLGQGPLIIGGTHRSITLTDAQCLVNLVPGVGNPDFLGNCQQTNCVGCNPAGPIGMKNVLATNTIALELNMRFNVEYNDLMLNAIRAQGLGCLAIDPNIVYCIENDNCKLRIFESNGTAHTFPYTLGGLLDLSNLFLDGGWSFTAGQKYIYAAAINNTLNLVNGYWHNGVTPTACDQSAGVSSPIVVDNHKVPTVASKAQSLEFTMSPNPASSEVSFRLDGMSERQDVQLEMYNAIGQQVLSRKFDQVSSLNELVNTSQFRSGVYFVKLKVGEVRIEQKLVISQN